MDKDKQKIIDLFNKNVRGKKPNTDSANQNHDGKGGHWLETQMGIKHNGDNAPDLFGFEMKNNTTSKTTFGDWSPSRNLRIFRRGNEYNLSRSDFLLAIYKALSYLGVNLMVPPKFTAPGRATPPG